MYEACSWKEGSRCFPGKCSDTTVESCECTTGFFDSKTDCASLHIPPSLMSMEMIVIDNSNDQLIVKGVSGHILWTKLNVFTSVNAKVTASYQQILADNIPSYINRNGTKVGLVHLSLNLQLIRGNTQTETNLYDEQCYPNMNDPSSTCRISEQLDKIFFNHGDRLKLTASATNGGKVSYFDLDNGINKTMEYNIMGSITINDTYLWIDQHDPYHHSSEHPFQVPDITTNSKLTVRWSGWTDDLSGIGHYEIDIFRLVTLSGIPTDSIPLKSNELFICSTCRNITSQQVDIKLPPEKGPYALFLMVFDKAGNNASARRITVFDDQPVVNFIPGSQINITTASEKTNYTWISKYSSFVDVNWTGRFISEDTDKEKWLNEVATFWVDVSKTLDDYEGRRTVKKVDNERGVFKKSFV